MRRVLKILSAVLLAIYVADLLLKKFFSDGALGAWTLPETTDYLCLFFAVGCFLLAIVRIESADD
jgi:hypothetical protein